MRYLLFPLVLLVLLSCKKESTPTAAFNQTIDTTIALLTDSGVFINGPYGEVIGKAKIYRTGGSYQVALQNFMSSNGPDLKVYLGKEIQPVNFVNLGSLQSTSGNQLYNIPAGVPVSEYSYVLIHCQQYNHLFGYAALKQ